MTAMRVISHGCAASVWVFVCGWCVGCGPATVAGQRGASSGEGASRAAAASTAASSPANALQLHGLATPAAVPRQGGRNPFAFLAPAPLPTEAPPTAVAPPPPEELLDVPTAVPLLSLIGIAERNTDAPGGRTAIISGLGELFLVTEGDAVTSRYTVRAITAAGVELLEPRTGHVLRLALKSSR